MPTGYTYPIEEGCTFEEYVWGCARAFGACVTMRDDPTDKPIPDEFKPSEYHAKAILKAEVELARLEAMTTEEVTSALKKEREEAGEENTRYVLEQNETKARYEAIRKQVEDWLPPSPDHGELKKFMLQQIDISIPDKPYERELPITDPAAWLAHKKSEAQRNLAYHRQEHAKELDRTAGRNRWIQQLRGSIPQPNRKAAA